MAGNVLWTEVFNKPGSQSQELTRQRIMQEERSGKRCSFGSAPQSTDCPDVWVAPQAERQTLAAPIAGYTGAVARVRPEFIGPTSSEAASAFTQPCRSATAAMAPGGGSSALGTAPVFIPGSRASERRTISESLDFARKTQC